MGEARVSAIIANWNGAEHLRLCLPSLLSQSSGPLEILVVDNHSSDDSSDVAKHFGVRWLPLERNVGLAPALNRGAAIALGDFLLFVNNDMRFHPHFVGALLEALENDEEVFAADGRQFNWEGTLQGHMAARLTNVRRRSVSSTELVPGLYFYQRDEAKNVPVFMASAACMMVRKAFFEKLGGFDDRLPLGYEDVEICWRAWIHRWKTVFVPNAICWHRVGASGGSEEGARLNFQGILRGRLLLATKLLPSGYTFRTWTVSVAALGRDLFRLRWKFAIDRVAVLFQMVGLITMLLQERKTLFGSANVSPKEQLDALLRLATDNESVSR